MNKTAYFLFFLLFSLSLFAQTNTPRIAIIPQPVYLKQGLGYFKLPENISVHSNNSAELQSIIAILGQRITPATGYQLSSNKGSGPASINLTINDSYESKLGNEGYRLNVTVSGVNITANKPFLYKGGGKAIH
jgi:hexosaminidase